MSATGHSLHETCGDGCIRIVRDHIRIIHPHLVMDDFDRGEYWLSCARATLMG